jgi:hypothetical protein
MNTELKINKDNLLTLALCISTLFGIFSLAFPVQGCYHIGFLKYYKWIWGFSKGISRYMDGWHYYFNGFYLFFAVFFLLGIGIKIYIIITDFKKIESKFRSTRYIVEILIGIIFLIGAIVAMNVLTNWSMYDVQFGLKSAYIAGFLDIVIGLLRKFIKFFNSFQKNF